MGGNEKYLPAILPSMLHRQHYTSFGEKEQGETTQGNKTNITISFIILSVIDICYIQYL